MNFPETAYYFQRFGFCPAQITVPPSPHLKLVVVIPCYNEPDLLSSLRSLSECESTDCAVEVIVVVNAKVAANAAITEQNEQTLVEARAWAKQNNTSQLTFHILDCTALPPKKAGVGLARKIGMDEALRRFDCIRNTEGIIACFDADCTCEPNYLTKILRFFESHSKAPGCSIYFEHPLEGSEAASVYHAVTLYELHLRYYVEGLRYARFPHAYHTIGSSMAVRSDVYLKQGGMNKRQAGEDFYFLHKIIPLGNFGEINATRVLASPRPSDRVPFGTGRAVRDILSEETFRSYPCQAFEELRLFFCEVPTLYETSTPLPKVSNVMGEFLRAQEFEKNLQEIRRHSASAKTFEKRFFQWFDGFLAMKFIHFARDKHFGSADVVQAAGELLRLRWNEPVSTFGARELLLQYRRIQRHAGQGIISYDPWPGATENSRPASQARIQDPKF